MSERKGFSIVWSDYFGGVAVTAFALAPSIVEEQRPAAYWYSAIALTVSIVAHFTHKRAPSTTGEATE